MKQNNSRKVLNNELIMKTKLNKISTKKEN